MATPASTPVTAHSVLQQIISTRFPSLDKTAHNKAVEAIQRWAQEVIYHESGIHNTIQENRTTGKLDGPGRGWLQYEMAAHGGSASNKTAINRALKWFKEQSNLTAPAWLTALSGRDVDFCTLSADQQLLIFYCDKNAHPHASLKALIEAYGTDSWKAVSESNWRKGHYGGSEGHKWKGSDAPPFNAPEWNVLELPPQVLG